MQKIHAKQALLPTGWVNDLTITVDQGRIVAVDPMVDGCAGAHDMILPAVMNLHSHGFQRAMSGLTETRGAGDHDSFWTWRAWMYQFLDQMTPDHLQAVTAMAYVDMIEAGFSAVAEFHYLHNDIGGTPYLDQTELSRRVLAAATDVGMGLTLLPVLYQYAGCDGSALQGGQKRFGMDIDRYANLVQSLGPVMDQAPADYGLGIAPHSLRAVSPSGVTQAVELAGHLPIHMHIAEQQAEVDQTMAHLGARPVDWILGHAPVSAQWCFIHCTHMTPAETHRLAATGAVAGLCPVTEANLGDGIFNGVMFDLAGGRVGVGTDSNVSISLTDELRQLEYSQRLAQGRRAVFAQPDQSTGRRLWDQAAASGAQAGGRASGAIRIGDWADIMAVDLDNPDILNRRGDAALDSLIFGTNRRNYITDVWSAGRHVVKQGRHIHRDRIETQFMRVMSELE